MPLKNRNKQHCVTGWMSSTSCFDIASHSHVKLSGYEVAKNSRLPEPVTFGDTRVTANSIVLIRHPYKDDDVKCGGAIIEELGHDSFHSYK